MSEAPGKGKFIPIWHEERDWLARLKVGDVVERRFSSDGPGDVLVVTARSPTRITCAALVFDAGTGAELNEALGWGTAGTGSFIRPPGH